jgi:hypothetical protein
MAKVRAIKTSFNGGEISKQLYGRVDLENFIASNKQLKNVLPTVYGSAMNRGGTIFVNENIKLFFETLQEVTGVTDINCVSIDYTFSRYVFGCDNGYIARCDFDFSNVVVVQLTYSGNPLGDILQVAQTGWYNDRNSYKVSTSTKSYNFIPSVADWSSYTVLLTSGDSNAEKLFDLEPYQNPLRNNQKLASFDGLVLRFLTVQIGGNFSVTDSYIISENTTNDFDGFKIDDDNFVLRNETNLYFYHDDNAVSLGVETGTVIGARLQDENVCVYVYKQIDSKYCVCCNIYSFTGELVKQLVLAKYDSDIGINRAIVVGDKVVCVGTVKSVCIYKSTVFELDFAGTCLSSAINQSNDAIVYCDGDDNLHIVNNYTDVSTKRVLVPFRVNKLINYIIEFGDNIIRFYKNRELVKDGNGDVYEINSPYAITDLIDNEGKLKINYVQNVDVLYICNKDFPIQTLKRYGDANWVIEEFSLVGGPFGDVNSDKSKVLTSTGNTDLITINAELSDYTCTCVPSGGGLIPASVPASTMWQLDDTVIVSVNRSSSLQEAVNLLYATDDGANFNISVENNNIIVKTAIAGYSGKVLSLRIVTPSEPYSHLRIWSGSFNSSAAADIFSAEDEGKLIRLNYIDSNTVMWESGKSVSENDIRKSGNNYYKATTSGTTGQIKPIHTEGIVSDGGVKWEYLHSGYGVGTILEVVNASKIKVNVDGYMPDFSNGTYLWELGLVGGGIYPNCCAFYKERFVFSISTDKGTKICASCAGDYNNFSDNSFGDILPENAIIVLLQGNQESVVVWMVAMNKLYIGTACEEFVFGEQTIAEVLSPTNVMCLKVSSLGSASIMPLHILDELLFVSNNEKQIANFTYVAERDSFRPINISLFFEHLLLNGVKCWAYTKEPYKTIWFSDKDGNLRSISYDADNKVCAGARHDIGGKVVSMAVIPEPNGNYDELWLVVERTVDGRTAYFTERLSWGLVQDSNVSDEYLNKKQVFSDCAKVVESNENVAYITGLYFLEGKTVNVLVDGKIQNSKTVVDGVITLDKPGKIVVVGLGYEALIETLFINIGATDGTSQGLPQRVSKLIIRYIKTRFLEAKASGGNQFENVVDSDELQDSYDKELHLPSDYDKAMTIMLKNDKPVSCCVLCIVPEMKTYQ